MRSIWKEAHCSLCSENRIRKIDCTNYALKYSFSYNSGTITKTLHKLQAGNMSCYGNIILKSIYLNFSPTVLKQLWFPGVGTFLSLLTDI